MSEIVSFDTYKTFLTMLLEHLEASFGQGVILSFALFGSVARGEARPDSDVDVLIVHRAVEFNPVKRFVDTLFELGGSDEYKRLKDRGLNPDPYPIFMTREALWETPHILLDILDHGIILYDTGPLEERLQALRNKLLQLGSRRVLLEDGRWYWDLKPDWKPGEVVEL